MKKILLFTLLLLIVPRLYAQERMDYIYYKTPPKSKLKASPESLELPFFDDFSTSSFYPDNKKWLGENVFVNSVYPVNPPSLGVVTFDAVKNTGEFYSIAGYENHFSADTITSLPINLNFENDNTIYLSFYYQAQGIGDNPESKDSLILEFYAPMDSVWTREWAVEGSTVNDFKQVILNIKEPKYLQNDFRFRFRNIASLSGNNAPSKVVNADHWHLDYIYLNRGRSATDTVPKDIAFVYPMQSFLKNYEAMPWKHFLTNTEAQLSKTTNVVYKNNDKQKRHIDSIYYEFIDYKGQVSKLNGGSYDVEAGEIKRFNPPYTYGFLSDAKDSTTFIVKAKFITDEYDAAINNTLVYYQKFYDYYAYDDGTAEASYGITGDGAQRARLAFRFNCLKKDVLRAVQMYFCRSLNNKSEKYFNLTIWNDDNGKPGEIIYQRQAVRPEYEDELNKFHTYFINDKSLVLEKGVFYVGWVQTTADMLNIGLDLNKDNSKNIFYSIGGDWQNSKFEASLMIRPFFGENLTLATEEIKPDISSNDIVVFPNPARNTITIKITNAKQNYSNKVFIYSLLGRLVGSATFDNNKAIDIGYLQKGTYILKVYSNNKSYIRKIVKEN